ncbi:MAG: serine hydrolase [Cyclobacteriaceae bacterium]
MKTILTIILGIVCQIGFAKHPNLDRFLNRKMKRMDRIGMQAAYIVDGKLAWKGSYGIKTYGESATINDSTIFMIASSSKPVTALAIMKLYDQGLLDLDQPINDILPFEIINPNYPEEQISTRMLLAHVSSIRDNWNHLEKGYTIDNGGDSNISMEEFLKSYLIPGGKYYDGKKNFYVHQPTEVERYTNVGYTVLGYIVERVTGQPFNEYMRKEIFQPLGMKNTFWKLAEVPHRNIATPHNMPYKETDFKGTQVLTHFGYPEYPAGQLRTSVSDYAKFLNLLINDGQVDGKQFLKKSTVEEFLRVQYPSANKWRAISWSYNEVENPIYNLVMPRRPSHSGLDPGMASMVSFDPAAKAAVIFFTNSPTTTFWSEKIFYLDMVKRLFKEAKRASN